MALSIPYTIIELSAFKACEFEVFKRMLRKKMSFSDFNVSITSRIGLCLHNWPNVLSCLSSKDLAYHHQLEIYTHLMRAEKHHDGCDLILGGVRGNTSGKTESLNAMHAPERFSELTVWKASKGAKQDSSLTYNQILGMPRETSVQQTQWEVESASLSVWL